MPGRHGRLGEAGRPRGSAARSGPALDRPPRGWSGLEYTAGRVRPSLPSLLAALLAVLSLGCQTVGPTALRHGRGNYNAAIQQTNSEQLLLNLIRLRYRDAPLFLEV